LHLARSAKHHAHLRLLATKSGEKCGSSAKNCHWSGLDLNSREYWGNKKLIPKQLVSQALFEKRRLWMQRPGGVLLKIGHCGDLGVAAGICYS
jgi:hypothetical protein